MSAEQDRFRAALTRSGWTDYQLYCGAYVSVSAPRAALTAMMEEALEAKLWAPFVMVLDGPTADTAAGCTLALAQGVHLFNYDDYGLQDGSQLRGDDGGWHHPGQHERAMARRQEYLDLGAKHGIDLEPLLAATPGYFYASVRSSPTALWLGQGARNNKVIKMKMVQKAFDEAGFAQRVHQGGLMFGDSLVALEGPGRVDLPGLRDQVVAMQARLDAFYQTKGGARLYTDWTMDAAGAYLFDD